MKIPLMALMLLASWLFTACSTARGGSDTQSDSAIGSESHPVATTRPAQRPGMTSGDAGDAQFGTKPDAFESPPPSNP